MSRIVEAILGHRRCDCKCNRVKQPVIINNNIYVPQSQPQQSSGGGTSVPVGVGAPSGATAPQTQTYTLTSSQYNWNLTPNSSPNLPYNSMLVVKPAYMGLSAPGFIYQLSNASTVTVTITANNRSMSFSDKVSKFEPNPSSTYMQSATMSSSVSGDTSTLTAETSTFDQSILNINSINFLVYNDYGHLRVIRHNITSVSITITYNAGGGFNNNSA